MYFDPGFGSMVIQAIMAVIAGGGIFFYKFRNLFFKKKKDNIKQKYTEKTKEENIKTFNEDIKND